VIKPDLVFLRQGQPIAVVEAKGRPVPASFQNAVRHQLHHYMTATNSPWSILVDPDHTTIFRRYEVNRPWSTLSTGELFGTANIRAEVIGERVLLEAVNRWVHELPHHREILDRHPELRDFVKDVSEGITSTEEWPSRA
jgi:hypothetical protein